MQTSTRLFGTLGFVALLASACDGSVKATSDAGAGPIQSSSGAVLGPLDHHCAEGDAGQRMQSIGACLVDDPSSVPAHASACVVSFSQDAGTAHEPADAGTMHEPADGGDADTAEYGPTMYGSAANDDDCKYYVSWVATAIQENADTYFTVTATRLADGKPASCAGIRPDVSLSLTHGVPAPRDAASEIAPGVYRVGPIRFDAPGRWTARFHLYEECNDTPENSPHGHVAFYVNVP